LFSIHLVHHHSSFSDSDATNPPFVSRTLKTFNV